MQPAAQEFLCKLAVITPPPGNIVQPVSLLLRHMILAPSDSEEQPNAEGQDMVTLYASLRNDVVLEDKSWATVTIHKGYQLTSCRCTQSPVAMSTGWTGDHLACNAVRSPRP